MSERCGTTYDAVTRQTTQHGTCTNDAVEVNVWGEGRWERGVCVRHWDPPPTNMFKGPEDY